MLNVLPYNIENQRLQQDSFGVLKCFEDITFIVEGTDDYEYATMNELISSNETIQQKIEELERKVTSNSAVINLIEQYRG